MNLDKEQEILSEDPEPDPIRVDVVCQNSKWQADVITQAKIAAQKAIAFALPQKQKNANLSLALVLADRDFIQELNQRFRNINAPTNVLAFPADEKTILGDIIIAWEVLCAEAQDKKITPSAHAAHLAVHGALHLLGFTHAEDEDAEIMEGMEIQILNRLGFQNPYQEEASNV